MAARLFLTTWTLQGDAIHNPIVDYVDTLPDMGITCMMFYGDADANGLPDFPLVMVLVHATAATAAQVEQLGGLTGVHLVPSLRPSYLLTNIPAAKRQAIQTYLNGNGIDTSSLTASSTYGDLVRLVVNAIAPTHGHPGLLKWATTNEPEFD